MYDKKKTLIIAGNAPVASSQKANMKPSEQTARRGGIQLNLLT